MTDSQVLLLPLTVSLMEKKNNTKSYIGQANILIILKMFKYHNTKTVNQIKFDSLHFPNRKTNKENNPLAVFKSVFFYPLKRYSYYVIYTIFLYIEGVV